MACKLSSRELAALLVDTLVDSSLIREDAVPLAIDIAAEEIEVRKAIGDYEDTGARPDPLTNTGLAELIVDALYMAKLVSDSAVQDAIEMTAEQLDLRRTISS